eukprot:TRINITY_DN7313_c0_g1_i1.p1 TRINITY_DN7313_c0_g1~~TRINITY_DN7313_c0_g1_i1.p1  ORF type:complete len:366 (-),score=69.45 TRINITY_DN7313_c0_g1_i1:27-1124(-)
MSPLFRGCITASPITDGYRNQVEFSAGLTPKGDPMLGFVLKAKHRRTRKIAVGDPSDCILVSHTAKRIRDVFQKMIEESRFPVYDLVERDGVWRTLELKTMRSGENMVIVQVCAGDLSSQDVADLKRDIIKACTESPVPIHSLLYEEHNGINVAPGDLKYEILQGEEHVHEEILGKRFRIARRSFFQSNTPVNELILQQISKWCQKLEDGAVLDLGCGTGTIAISVADQVKTVIGIESVESAVEDAIFNAKINGVKNARFIVSKAEDKLKEVLDASADAAETSTLTIILDPPRQGFHPSVVEAVRNCSRVKRVIFVSCDPAGLKNNIPRLCEPGKSSSPFFPVEAACFDMFPHTRKSEVLLLLER